MAKKKTYNPLVGFNTPYFTNLEESNAYNAGEADSRINAFASTPAYSAGSEDTGFLSAIGRGLTSGAAGVVQGQAQLGNLFGVGDGQLAQYLQGVNERNARKKEYTIADMIPFATDYWTNPEGMTYDVSNLLGSSGAMMAETGALMTGAGAVGGALGLGGAAAAGGGLAGALSRGASVASKADKLAGWMAGAASKRGYEKLANVLSGPMGRMYALNILKTPIEVSSEAGQAGADALAEGASVGEARTRAGVVAAIQMPLLFMSNTFESANLGSLFAKKTGEKVSKQGIMSILGSITKEGLQNAWEEGMQQSSQEYAADKQSLLGVVNPLQWSEEAQQQAAVGGVGGAVLGLGNAAGGRLIGKKQDEAESQPEPQPQPQQQTTADPTKGARQFLDDLAENAETPEDRKIIGDMADAENPEDVMAAARQFGWKPADEQETVTADSNAEEQQQAATDAVNQTINNMNNGEEDAAEPPTEQPVEQPTEQTAGQQGNVGGGRPMDKMSAARQNIPAQLAQNKSTAKYLDNDGNVDTGKLRGSVRLKRFLDETPDAMIIGKKALAGDTNAITRFLKYTPAKQAAILDAIDNGADNWKLTDQDKEAIKSYDAKQRAKAVTNLRDAVAKAVNAAGYKPTDKGKALAVAKNGSEQELSDLAKKLKVTIPEIINRVAAPTENVTAKPPKPDKAPAGDGNNNNNNNNGNQGNNGNAPAEAKQNLGEYTLSQVIKGQKGGMIFKYRHAGNNGTVALIGRSVKGHYVASVVKKGEKTTDKKIAFNSLEEAENYVANYKEPAPANNNNNGNIETPPSPVTPPTPAAPVSTSKTTKLAIGNTNVEIGKSPKSGDYGFKVPEGISWSKEEMDDLKAAGFSFTSGWMRAKDTEAVQKFIDKYKVKKTEGGNDNAGNDQNDMGNSGSGTGQQNNGQNPQSGQGQQGQGNNQGQGQNQQAQGVKTPEQLASERKKLFDKAKENVAKIIADYTDNKISYNDAKAKVKDLYYDYSDALSKNGIANHPDVTEHGVLFGQPNNKLDELKKAKETVTPKPPAGDDNNNGDNGNNDNGNNGNIKPPAQEPIVTDYPQYGIKITEVTKRNHNELLYPEAEVAKIRAKNDAAIWGVVQKVLDEFKKDLTIEPKTAKNKLKEIKKAFKTGNKQPPYNYALMDKIDNAINSISTLNTERLKKVKEQLEQEKQQKAQAYTDAVKKCREDADAIIKDFSEKKLDYDAAKAKIQELIDDLPKQLADAGLKALTAKDKASIEKKLDALDRAKEKLDKKEEEEAINAAVTQAIPEGVELTEEAEKVYNWVKEEFRRSVQSRFTREAIEAAATILAYRAQTYTGIFNSVYGTNYTPLDFAQRYQFKFYRGPIPGASPTAIGNTSYYITQDSQGHYRKKREDKIEISFAGDADTGALFHELAHAFITDLVMIAENDNAPQQLKDDLRALEEYVFSKNPKTDKQRSYNDEKRDVTKHYLPEEKMAQSVVKFMLEEVIPIPRIREVVEGIKKSLQTFVKWVDETTKIAISKPGERAGGEAYAMPQVLPQEIKNVINRFFYYQEGEYIKQTINVEDTEDRYEAQIEALEKLSAICESLYEFNGASAKEQEAEFNKLFLKASTIAKSYLKDKPLQKAAITAGSDMVKAKKALYKSLQDKKNFDLLLDAAEMINGKVGQLEDIGTGARRVLTIFFSRDEYDIISDALTKEESKSVEAQNDSEYAFKLIEQIVDYDLDNGNKLTDPESDFAKRLAALADMYEENELDVIRRYADLVATILKTVPLVQKYREKEKAFELKKQAVELNLSREQKQKSDNAMVSFDEAADSDLGETLYQAAWHGTPYIFDEFDNEHNGSGEGPNIHGWGLYFAKNKDVSAGYREKLSKKKETGRFEITLPNGKQYYISNFKDAASRKIEYKDGSLVDITKEPAVVGALNLLADNNMDRFGLDDELTQRINDIYNKDISLSKQMAEAQPLEDIREIIWNIQNGSVSEETLKGALLNVEIPNSDVLLDEDEKFVAQPKVVQEAIMAATKNTFDEEVDAIAKEYPEITEARKMKKPEFHELTEEELQKEIKDRKKLHKELFSNYQLPSDDILRQRAIESNKSFYENDLSWYNENKGVLPSILDDFKQAIEDSAREHEEMERIINRFVDQLPWGDYSKRAELRARLIMSALKQFDLYESAYNLNGADYYYYIETAYGSGLAKNASLMLNSLGVKGIKYEGGIDGTGFVIFDAASVAIKERYDAVIAKNKEALQRSYDEIVKKLEERFKGCKIEYVGNNDMRVTAPNGISFLVKVKDKIVLNEKQAEKARKAHGIGKDKQVYAVGAYTPVFNGEVNGIVKVALNSKKGTETHEITHAAIATSLTDKEYDALMTRGEQIAKETGVKANKEELVCNAVQNYVVARENGYVTAFTAEERAELEKTPWGKMLLNLNRAGREAQLFSKLNQEKLSQTAWGKMILAKYKLKRAMAKLFQKVYDFVKNMQAVFQAVDNFHNVARKIEMGEVWKNKKNLRSNKAKYQNAGVKAKTANIAKLKTAEQMEKDGASREDIFDTTGWWRGEDGQWRFEILTRYKQFDKEKAKQILSETVGTPLPVIINNKELFDAYPFLNNVKAFSVDMEQNMLGSVSQKDRNSIYLNRKLVQNAGKNFDKVFGWDTIAEVLTHEIQHLIQFYEGHAIGANPIDAQKKASEQLANKMVAASNNEQIKKAFEYCKFALRSVFAADLQDEQDPLEAFVRVGSEFGVHNGALDYSLLQNLTDIEKNELRPALKVLIDEYRKYNRDDGFTAYTNVAGEKEAKVAEFRMGVPEEWLNDPDDFRYPWRTNGMVGVGEGEPILIYADEDGTQFQIVGEHGASTDQAKLNQAKDMERSGSSKEEIFDATGWWRGADSRWRFEIKDALNGINFKKLSEEPVKLSEIYDNEELYEHYPFLRDVPVKEEAMPGLLGWSNGKEISLAVGLAEEDELSTKKVLLHELQHVIQEHEGFATGGTPSTAVEKAANAYYKMTRVTLPTLYDRIDPKYSYWKTRLNNILAREAAGKPNKTDAAQKPKLEAKIQKANEAYLKNTGDQGTLDKIEQYEANLAQLQWQEKDFEGMVKDYVDMGMPEETARGYIAGHTDRNGVYYESVASHYYYKALYGEQEARAAETRSDNPSQYPWEDYEGNWNKHPLIIYDTATSASRRGPLDESLADIDAAYKEQLDNALASGANNSELVAIMMAHQDAYFARLNERERERLEKQKLRANELRELRRMFKAGQIDEYTIGGVVIRRNENGEEEAVSVTNDFATRKYVNRRGEGKNFANATEALKDAVHSTPTRTFFATAKEWLKDQKDHFYRNWIDKNDDLGIFDKAYMQAMGDTIDAAETMRAKAQMVTNSANGAAFALIDGDEATVKAAQRKYGFKNAISMRMIINKLMEHKATFADYIKKYYSDVAGDQAYIDAFGNYLVAKSLLEASNNHRIDYDKEVAKWKADGSKGSQPIFQEYKFPRGMTEEAVREVVKAAPKGFSALAEMYYKYNENLLDILQASGLISADLHKLLNGKYKAYCPLMRDFTDTAAVEDFVSNISAGKSIANVTDPLQRRRSEGSSRDIVSPLEVTVKSTSAIIARCERNKVGQLLVDRAAEAGLTELCERVQGNAGDAKNCIFTVMRNGVKEAYKTTPELYPAVTHCFEPAIKMQMGFLTAPARLLRAGATMSPSFIIRNFLRDTIFASISSKNGFIPIVDSVRGAYALWQNEQRRAEFDAAGIISSAFYGDDEGVRRSLDEMAGGKFEVHSFLDIVRAIGHYPVQFLKFMSDNIEASTRMGEFMRARQKGKTVDQAAYEAVEITLNFNRSGIEGQQVNRVIPFFNACIQGGDKLYRLFKEDAIGTMGRIGLYIILPSIVLWALNHDEEWYKELDPNIKATNWLLPGGIRIPKPQEAGILFGTGAEAVLDTAFEQDPKSMSNFINAFKDAMLPNFLPTALLPIIEWQANYSFFRGKPIVNARQQKLPDEMQYGPYTSETAKFVGKYSGLSPVKIDNTVRNIGGTMGMALVQMPDLFAAEKQNLPAKKISEMFIVRDFLVNDMNKNRTMNDFYSLVDAATKQHAAYGKAGKPTKEVSAINAANGLIAKNRKMIRDITESRKLNSLQKRARIDKIEKDSIRIAKIAIKKYGKNFDY